MKLFLIRNLVLISVLLTTGFGGLRGQSVDVLQNQISSAEQDIKRINLLIANNGKKLTGTTEMIKLVGTKIKNRELIIKNIESQIRILHRDLGRYQGSIKHQSSTLEQLTAQHERMIREAYINYKANNFTALIFDSQTFSQAARRMYYLNQYHNMARRRALEIQGLRTSLTAKVDTLTQRERELLRLNKEKASEVESLLKERAELDTARSKLTKNSANLKARAKANRVKIDALQRKIREIIEQEARRAAAEMAVKRQNSRDGGRGEDAASLAAAREFEKGKGGLVSPLLGGVLVDKFGIHDLAGQPGVKVNNRGVNITSRSGSNVRAVYGGQVRRVFLVSGMGSSVIVRHEGGYLTVYSNLSSVSVKQGDNIAAGQNLGQITENLAMPATLHFEIWKETEILNPELWVRF